MARSTDGPRKGEDVRASAPVKDGLRRTLVLAGKEKDPPGLFVGFDGEQSRFAGEKFWYYGEPLPSWCRINVDGKWVDVRRENERPRGPSPLRRAGPNTAPGQAPKERIRQLVEDEALLSEAVDLPVASGREAPVSGRASDETIG